MLASLVRGIAPVALRQPFKGPIVSYVRHNSALYPASNTTPRPAQFTPPSPTLIKNYDPSRPNIWKNLVEDKEQKLPRLGAEETWTEREGRLATLSQHNQLHNTYTGRSVAVQEKDVGTAFTRLQTILRRNRVVYELKWAQRHEKKGDKRRRLESERWRRLFAHEVRKKVKLVNVIRARGA